MNGSKLTYSELDERVCEVTVTYFNMYYQITYIAFIVDRVFVKKKLHSLTRLG